MNSSTMTAKDLEHIFFKELKAYNQPNFKAIAKADTKPMSLSQRRLASSLSN